MRPTPSARSGSCSSGFGRSSRPRSMTSPAPSANAASRRGRESRAASVERSPAGIVGMKTSIDGQRGVADLPRGSPRRAAPALLDGSSWSRRTTDGRCCGCSDSPGLGHRQMRLCRAAACRRPQDKAARNASSVRRPAQGEPDWPADQRSGSPAPSGAVHSPRPRSRRGRAARWAVVTMFTPT